MLFHSKKINFKMFEEKAIRLSTSLEADALFDSLERAVSQSEYIIIDRSMHDYGPEQIIMRFLDKYKGFIEYYYVDMNVSHGCTYLKLKNKVNAGTHGSYSDLENDYTEDYYMNDCGGYDDFKSSNGTKIEQRLQDVYNLINPVKTDRILDIGCGRGELSFALSSSGADVTGVDYSADAIKIAKKTYDGKRDNLQYVQADIFQMNQLDIYDKIVMADVVEHIEQDVLEKIFDKIAHSLNDNGILVVHTAPNKDYYDYCYPDMRRAASEFGCYLPCNPRSYYEQLMHINEQSPETLRTALEKYFKCVCVWTGSVMEIDAEKSFEESCRDNQIFAFACNEKSVLEKTVNDISVRPEYERCSVEINADDLRVKEADKEAYLDIEILNQGDELLSSRRKYPINLSYHITDGTGKVIVYDGERTPINDFIRKGSKKMMTMKIRIPDSVCGGVEYSIDITLVAEGCFWLDRDGKNKKRINMIVIEGK